jgi:hypothetical protein
MDSLYFLRNCIFIGNILRLNFVTSGGQARNNQALSLTFGPASSSSSCLPAFLAAAAFSFLATAGEVSGAVPVGP